MEKKFKCKDEVIYIYPGHEWTFGIFSHYGKTEQGIEYVVIDGDFYRLDDSNILPYEGNEHLVGTTDNPDEEVRLEEFELLICNHETESFIGRFGRLCQFVRLDGGCFEVEDSDTYDMTFKYAIRFKDFDPSNMEETKKHILCVKNGRIVRYKG